MKYTLLIVSRKKEYWNFIRSFKIYVDGSYLGSLRNGETKLYRVEKSIFSVRIKQAFSFFRSKDFPISNDKNDPIFLEASTGWLGVIANVSLLLLIASIGLAEYFNFALDLYFACLLIVTLILSYFGFFVFADRYVIIRRTKNPIRLKVK